MSSSSAPSLGVVSVTITLPGPCTVITHLSPARSVPETTLPALLNPGLLGLYGIDLVPGDEELALFGDRIGHQQVRGYPRRLISRDPGLRAPGGSPAPRACRVAGARSDFARNGWTASVGNSWKTPSLAALKRASRRRPSRSTGVLRRSGSRPPWFDGHPALEILRYRRAEKRLTQVIAGQRLDPRTPSQRSNALTPLSIGAGTRPPSSDL